LDELLAIVDEKASLASGTRPDGGTHA